jgi:hypothetical protein
VIARATASNARLTPWIAVWPLIAASVLGGACGADQPGGANDGGSGGASTAIGGHGATGAGGHSGAGGAGGAVAGQVAAGWLYTSGNKVYLSHGSGAGTVWVGRGVNMDDIFSWLGNFSQYRTPMTDAINAIGAHAGVYVLVTLRSDVSMIGQDTTDGDPEATGIPSDATTTPNASQSPIGTDAVYVALVDSFASSPFVLFGLTNEPGGNKRSNATLSAAMSHAVGVIRAEEDHLGVPHHVVSVQGNSWTSDISFYAQAPLPYDNVVYEIHGYPPRAAGYTYANLPVIIGEYGSLDDTSAPPFFADVESKQIPPLAWDADPYSDCQPDLLDVNWMSTMLTPTAWGSIVMGYLTAHAP